MRSFMILTTSNLVGSFIRYESLTSKLARQQTSVHFPYTSEARGEQAFYKSPTAETATRASTNTTTPTPWLEVLLALFGFPVVEVATLDEEVELAVPVAGDPVPVAVAPEVVDILVPVPIAAEI
jgi:hypothetical protein